MSNIIDLEKERQKRAAKKHASLADSSQEHIRLIRQSIARINKLFWQIDPGNSRSR